MDETQCILNLLKQLNFSEGTFAKIQEKATQLVTEVRKRRLGKGGIDAFLSEYDLSTQEGIALMCLAEALLRIPDSATANRLIRDKIARLDWESHRGQSSSLFVNAATWGLIFTGKWLSQDETAQKSFINVLKKLLERGGEPLIRKAIGSVMQILGLSICHG